MFEKMIKNFCAQNLFPKIIIIVFILLIALNIYGLYGALKVVRQYKKIVDQQNIGFRFAGLDEFIKGERIIGFYTDMNLSQDRNSKDLAHAQYMLAPVIVDDTSVEYRYVLMFCKNPQNALKKMKEINAVPVRGNNQGVVLTERVNYR
ncbi:MAG: hypothetical protein KC684_01770 [Candidatus Omnitrophica bacterium]|nr:hypothetical protein [Candidatus Omnitrophota bacterium]